MPALRPIRPVPLPPGVRLPAPSSFGAMPERVVVPPGDLWVDDSYQRDINRRGMANIVQMVANFRWSKYKTPTAVRAPDGALHLIDGQHTAIAAITLGIPLLAIDVVDAATAQERAEAFVSHNLCRVAMTSLDIYRAQLGGLVAEAVAMDRALKEAGCRLRVLAPTIKPKVGDMAAVSGVRNLLRRRRHDGAVTVLSALVAAGRAPISASELAAVEEALFGASPIRRPDLVKIMRAMGPQGVIECHASAKREGVSTKVAILASYRRRAGSMNRAA